MISIQYNSFSKTDSLELLLRMIKYHYNNEHGIEERNEIKNSVVFQTRNEKL